MMHTKRRTTVGLVFNKNYHTSYVPTQISQRKYTHIFHFLQQTWIININYGKRVAISGKRLLCIEILQFRLKLILRAISRVHCYLSELRGIINVSTPFKTKLSQIQIIVRQGYIPYMIITLGECEIIGDIHPGILGQ